jgi:DUF1680 family protein
LGNENSPKEEVILKVNGRRIRKLDMEKGYAVIQRKWKKGDLVQVELPMNVRLVTGNPRIEDTHDKVVLMFGPMVYCVEEIDNSAYFENNKKASLQAVGLRAEYREDLLDGVVSIKGTATLPAEGEEIEIMAIPYYAWSNRGQGHMKVWLPAHLDKD